MWIVSIEGIPSLSMRRHAQELEILHTSVRTIMKMHLVFHSYKIVSAQETLPRDPVQHLQFTKHMLIFFNTILQ